MVGTGTAMDRRDVLDETEILVLDGEKVDHLDLLAKWFRGLDDPVRLGIVEEFLLVSCTSRRKVANVLAVDKP
jgi:hypothetical protein